MNNLFNQLTGGIINIIMILIQMAILAIVPIIFAYAKEKLGQSVTATLVRSVQQTAGDIQGAQKKLIVSDNFKKKLGIFSFLFSEENINHFIEAAVIELKSIFSSKANITNISASPNTVDKDKTEEKLPPEQIVPKPAVKDDPSGAPTTTVP